MFFPDNVFGVFKLILVLLLGFQSYEAFLAADMCDAASERRVERVCCPPVIFLPARNLVARGWGNPTDQASRPRGLRQGHLPPLGPRETGPRLGEPPRKVIALA